MRIVPTWALLSSGSAPVVLIGGWLIAAHLEGPAYDPVTQTISVLAAYGARGFWVMTSALAALGVCHLCTITAVVVALLPPPSSGGSLSHGTVAGIGFALLAVWPVLAAHRSATAPWGLRPVPAFTATAVMLGSAAWFMIEMEQDGAAGVAERLVTAVQSVWPFVVVASCLWHRHRRPVPQ